MNIKEILANQSVWTYNMIAGSSVLAEVIREDALTSFNLVSINNATRANNIDLSTTSMQGAKLESEYGADWLWSMGSLAYLIQAKKLEAVCAQEQMSYTIDIPQLQKLRLQAQTMSSFYGVNYQPIYVFYNSLLSEEYNHADWGCTYVPAEDIYQFFVWAGKLGQQKAKLPFGEVKVRMKPWYTLFDSLGSSSQQIVPQNNQADETKVKKALPW